MNTAQAQIHLHKFALSIFNESQKDMDREKLNKFLSQNFLVPSEKDYILQEKEYFCDEKYIAMFLIALLDIICILIYAKIKVRFITMEQM